MFLEEMISVTVITDALKCPDGSVVRNLPAIQETQVPSLGREDPLEEEMATHSSILAWRIPWTEGTWKTTVHRVVKGSNTTEGLTLLLWASQVALTHLPVKETCEKQVRSLGQEDPLEEGMATHSRILAWRIPWTEEPGGLQSMGSQRVKRRK